MESRELTGRARDCFEAWLSLGLSEAAALARVEEAASAEAVAEGRGSRAVPA